MRPRATPSFLCLPKERKQRKGTQLTGPPAAGTLRSADVLGTGKNSPFGLKQFAGLFPKTSTALRLRQMGIFKGKT